MQFITPSPKESLDKSSYEVAHKLLSKISVKQQIKDCRVVTYKKQSMKNSNISGLVILLTLSLFTKHVDSQEVKEPSSAERLYKSMTQLAAAVTVKKGLETDSNCQSKKYREISVASFVKLMALNQDQSKQAETMLKDLIQQAQNTKLPDGRISGPALYESMVKSAKENIRMAGGNQANYCDGVNDSADGLLQKAKDNIKLLEK